MPVIKAQKRQIQQVINNLISNALKYSKEDVPPVIYLQYDVVNGRKVDHPIAIKDLDTQFHLIQVNDNGIGFDQSEAEKIFKMFQRLHGKMEYEGTGIGLAIVKKVIENHRGYVWAESKPGEGSSFKVLLPC